MAKRRVIGLDFDDVLMDFNTSLSDYHNREYGTSFSRAGNYTVALEDIWGCDRDEANQRVLNFYRSDVHAGAPPVLGGPEAVRKLAEKHDVVVITSRPEYVREDTLKWLSQHYPDLMEKVHFTNHFMGNGVKKKKSEVCAELGVEVFVDDFISHASDIAESGREVLLFDTPWNQLDELHPKITRVRDWEHILEVLGEK